MMSESGETETPPRSLRPISLGVTLAAMVSIAASESASASMGSPQRRLAGCWSQTSPYPARQIPPGKSEWGSRTWCFRPRGLLETWNMTCGKSGSCDGWDGRFHYRSRGAEIELRDYAYDGIGSRALIWRKCLPVFENDDRFVLTNCEMSQDAFVRDKDPNRTH
jgi:hypothetical protein